jgi:hypothetical protein
MIEVEVDTSGIDTGSGDPRIDKAVKDALHAIALNAHRYAAMSILKGPKTGVVYNWVGCDASEGEFLIQAPQGHKFWAKKRATPHQSSGPGQPPANDFGFLVANIKPDVGDGLSVDLKSLAPYSLWLELGTRYMDPRPFLAPAGEKAGQEGPEIVDAFVKAALK